MANLGIALGAGVDEFNNQRRMAQADEMAAQQKQQFAWAKTAQEQHQAVKAARAKVISDADVIRKQYDSGDVLGAAAGMSDLHNGSTWDGGAKSKVAMGSDGKVYATRYNGQGLVDRANVQQQEVTPEFFKQALDHHTAYRMAEADPDNYLQNSLALQKSAQGDEHNAIARQGLDNSATNWAADRTSREKLSAEEIAARAFEAKANRDQHTADSNRSDARYSAGLRAQGEREEARWKREDAAATSRALAAQADSADREKKYQEGRADSQARMGHEAIKTASQAYDDGKAGAGKAEAGMRRFIDANFSKEKKQSPDNYVQQGISHFNLEASLSNLGQHTLWPSDKAWDGVNKTQWVLRKDLGGNDTFVNKATKQKVDVSDIMGLPVDQQDAFLGTVGQDGSYQAGSVIDSTGSPVNMRARLNEKYIPSQTAPDTPRKVFKPGSMGAALVGSSIPR